jgi:SAM-dependent methyltransferase
VAPESGQKLRAHVAALLRRGRRPRWGDLKRRQPFSQHYGFDRGQPVDRRYIEAFLTAHAARIRGDVLEVLRGEYTRRFGAPGTRSHVVDIDPGNGEATVIADLCEVGSLPARAYDCVVFTQTLQFLADPELGLENLWQSLRPGGALLVTVPCAARIDTTAPDSDYWRWTPAGLEHLVRRRCPGADVQVSAGGNLVASVAAFLGLAVEDLASEDLADDDPAFPLIAATAVLKLAD